MSRGLYFLVFIAINTIFGAATYLLAPYSNMTPIIMALIVVAIATFSPRGTKYVDLVAYAAISTILGVTLIFFEAEHSNIIMSVEAVLMMIPFVLSYKAAKLAAEQ